VTGMGTSWFGMALTHVELYLAGVGTTAVMAFVYEKWFARRSPTGVLCDDCHKRLDDPAGRSAGEGVPPGVVTPYSRY